MLSNYFQDSSITFRKVGANYMDCSHSTFNITGK